MVKNPAGWIRIPCRASVGSLRVYELQRLSRQCFHAVAVKDAVIASIQNHLATEAEPTMFSRSCCQRCCDCINPASLRGFFEVSATLMISRSLDNFFWVTDARDTAWRGVYPEGLIVMNIVSRSFKERHHYFTIFLHGETEHLSSIILIPKKIKDWFCSAA